MVEKTYHYGGKATDCTKKGVILSLTKVGAAAKRPKPLTDSYNQDIFCHANMTFLKISIIAS